MILMQRAIILCQKVDIKIQIKLLIKAVQAVQKASNNWGLLFMAKFSYAIAFKKYLLCMLIWNKFQLIHRKNSAIAPWLSFSYSELSL